jgi:hypothetical protein
MGLATEFHRRGNKFLLFKHTHGNVTFKQQINVFIHAKLIIFLWACILCPRFGNSVLRIVVFQCLTTAY